MSSMESAPAFESAAYAAAHDVFTHLCDCALGRAPRLWRSMMPRRYRLRFLRRTARAAGLAERHALTPLAQDWLRQSLGEQILILARAWAENGRGAARQRCLERVLSLASGATISGAELTGRRSAIRQRELWQPFVWLGYLSVGSGPGAGHLLARTDWPQASEPARSAPELGWDMAGGTVTAHPPYRWGDLLELEGIAELTALGPPRVYALSANYWKRAVARGATTSTAFSLLERCGSEPVVLETLKTLSSIQPDVTCAPGVLVTFGEAGVLEALRAKKTWRQWLGRALSPQHVWVRAAQAPAIVRALRRRGLAVDEHIFTSGSARSTGTELLHLLLAARVMQALARELDLPMPLDVETLGRLAGRLPLSQQRRLERAVAHQLAHVRAQLPEPRAVAVARPSKEVADGILEAIDLKQALQIYYQPPPPRPAITRPVIPLRLETVGAFTYLVAHCLHRDALRTFRLDRILGIATQLTHLVL